MKRIFLLSLGLVFLGGKALCKCPSCPERAIKREVKSSEKKIKTKKGYGSPLGRLQKEVKRKEPPIASAKTPFVSH